MKQQTARFLAMAMALLVAVGSGRAATLTWDANGATAGQTDGAGAWLNAGQWWDGSANQAWSDGGDAVFGVGGAGGAVTLGSATNVNSLTFNYFSGTYTLGTVGNAITLSNGITRNAGAATVAFASPVILGANQTWDNNSANQYSVKGGIDVNGYTLTIGGIGATDLGDNTANLITGSGAIIKNGRNSLIFNAGGTVPDHTFTGSLTIHEGRAAFQNANGLPDGNITINGGYLGARYGSPFTRNLGGGSGEIQILGGISGFSGEGSVVSQFQLNGAGSTVVWGSSNFNPTVLLLNGDLGMNANGKGSLNNAIDLNGTNRNITSLHVTDGAANSGFTVNGAISSSSGTAGLIKTGPGNVILAAAATYNGDTTINGGWITLSGAAGALPNTGGINLNGGILQMVNTAAGVDRVSDTAPIASAGGGITFNNTSGAADYTETLGPVTCTNGQLNIVESVNQVGAGSQMLTLSNLTRSGSAAVAFSAANTGPQAAGNKNMIVVTGAGTTPTNQIIGPWASVGTAANAQTDYAVYNSDYVTPANIASSAETAWTNAADPYTVRSTEAKGATTLTATRNIAALRNFTQANVITADATADTITLAGHTFVADDPVVFGATPPGGLTGGIVYYVLNPSGDTFQVAAPPGGAAINITSTGTPNIVGGIRLASGADLGTYGILNGVAAPLSIVPGSGGVVTLPGATSSNLYVTPGSSAITIAAPIADNGAGKLTLVKSGTPNLILTGTSTYTGDTVVNAGTLQLGINGTANGAKLGSAGTYAGNISVAAGATLHVQTDAAQTLGGVISGAGSLTKSYSGTLTLGSNNTYSGKTWIRPLTTAGAGTVVVYSFNSVNGGNPLLAGSSLGRPTTVADGTIEFGSGSVQAGGILKYTGPGETTDRVINFQFNGNGAGKTLEAAGGGPLKFTSRFTGSGSANNDIFLTGVGDGEIVEGLAVVFRNLTKSGSGTWTLGGSNVFYAPTAIQGGTLSVNSLKSVNGGASALGNPTNVVSGTIAIGNGGTAGTLRYTGTGDTSDRVIDLKGTTGGATLDQSGTGLLKFTSNFTATGAGGKTLTLQGSTAGLGEIAGAIVDNSGANKTSLTKAGSGTWTLSGANTYTGPTTVSNGTLRISGSLESADGPVTVMGGKLTGTGTIARAVTVSVGGALQPGDPTGALTVTGDLAVEAGATSRYSLGAVSARTDVNGNLSLAGTLDIVDAGGFAAGTNVLFTYTGALTYGGLTIGATPNPGYTYGIDTGTAGEVRLIVSGDAPPLSSFNQWQQSYFGAGYATNPLAAAEADPLGKGMSNTNQFLADLDPTNALSLLEIVDILFTNAAGARVAWTGGGTGAVQVLEASASLMGGPGWTNLFSCTPATPANPSFTNHVDLGGGAQTNRFYRIRAYRP